MAVNVLLVGGGRMGSAMLAGWLSRGIVGANSIIVVEPQSDAAAALRSRQAVVVVNGAADVAEDFDPAIVVFAVKPQVMATVVPDYRDWVRPSRVFLSIAAGITIDFLQQRLATNAAIVRSMPNTPAAVGRGISVACPNGAVRADQRALCQQLLESVGEAAWLDNEADLDAVTAVSGSGPAYVFLLIECLAEAGVAAGLAPDLAARLARATVIGSGELAHQSELSAAQLRENVTSPGGTTAAALETLMAKDGLAPLMVRAVKAAAARSRELAAG